MEEKLTVEFSYFYISFGVCIHINACAVMVDLPLILFPQTVYKCMQKDLREGNKQIEEEPSVHHLDIRRLGEALRDADEQGREDKKRGKIHCHYGFKEESFITLFHC